jgi:SNF2 family DNA or RNA helicase
VPFCEIVDGKISVQTDFHDRHLVKEVPGARYDTHAERWRVPLSWTSCITLRGLYGDTFTAGEKLAAWSWELYRTRIEPAMRMRDQLELDEPFPLLDELEADRDRKLYNYQRVDLKFLLTNRRALLANEPGLGKTGVVIRFLQMLQKKNEHPFPALIICPNSLKFATWQDELATWAPEFSVQVVDGGAVKRRKQLETDAQIYVINYESMRLHSKLAGYGSIALTEKETTLKELNHIGFKTVISDEAHKIKDVKAAQSRAVWEVMHEADNRIVMTGTPISQDVGDLWSLLHAIEPTWFPAKTKFLNRWAATSMNYFGGMEVLGLNPHTEAEFRKAVDPLIRRIPKAAALPQLPPKLPTQYRHTPMSPKQAKAYAQMRDDMIANLNELLVAPNPLSQLTRLAQFAAASAEIITVQRTRTVETPVRLPGDFVDANGRAVPDYLRDENGDIVTEKRTEEYEEQKVQLTAPSAKVDDMVDLLEEMGGEPLVVAAVSRQLIELAAARLEKLKISHGLITGAQNAYERQQAVQRFQAGNIRVVLMTLGAGAEGITLTRANTMLFMQNDWSEVKNMQGRGRIDRIGSEHHDCIRYIEQVTPDTVEEHKREVLLEKGRRMEEIVRDGPTLLKLLGAK